MVLVEENTLTTSLRSFLTPVFLAILCLDINAQIHLKSETNLFVFVGEKVKIDTFDSGWINHDFAFRTKYKVLETIYGTCHCDTIEFIVFDHSGEPAFTHFNQVLLYLAFDEKINKWQHEKYLYQEVYKCANGKWAGPYDEISYNYNVDYYKDHSIVPERIRFPENVCFDPSSKIKGIGYPYKFPFYKFKKGKAYPLMGNYVNELFLLKKNGMLKSRGYFQ